MPNKSTIVHSSYRVYWKYAWYRSPITWTTSFTVKSFCRLNILYQVHSDTSPYRIAFAAFFRLCKTKTLNCGITANSSYPFFTFMYQVLTIAQPIVKRVENAFFSFSVFRCLLFLILFSAEKHRRIKKRLKGFLYIAL